MPHNTAICAWDGSLTYSELNELSTKVACDLHLLGISSEKSVAIYMDKSQWAVVAVVGVLKAGGVCVPLSPTQPVNRIQMILDDIETEVILTNMKYETQLQGKATHVRVIDREILDSCDNLISIDLPTVSSRDAAFVIYTSRSSGTPKGVVQEHGAIYISLRQVGHAMGVSDQTRCFQFASYVFDPSICDLFGTMMFGGCVCVPSEEDRVNDLAGSMRSFAVTSVCMTAATLSTLRPADIPTLKKVYIGGDSLNEHLVLAWGPHVSLNIVYGTTETGVWDAIHGPLTAPSQRRVIGRAIGCHTWIVDPSDHQRLLPVGVVGEIVISGPGLARGYLNNAEKTKESYIEMPTWSSRFTDGVDVARCYKTGDLAFYHSNGSIEYVGRKDTQAKIRGQRVELGEVEHHVRRHFSVEPTSTVVAELIKPQESSNALLVVFLASDPATDSEAVQAATAGLTARLVGEVPSSMIPTAYVSLDAIPMTPTGKLDRRRLREFGSTLTLEQLMASQQSEGVRYTPRTTAERSLRSLWSAVLGINQDSISADDSFLRVGGDSITAMRLAQEAIRHRFSLTVADILGAPRLTDLARYAQTTTSSYKNPRPFSLLNMGDLLSEGIMTLKLSSLSNITHNVVDVYPTTDFQEQCVLAAMANPGGGCDHWCIDLPDDISIQTVVLACEKLWEYLEMLRTVFVRVDDRYFQAVVWALPPLIGVYEAPTSDLEGFSNSIYRTDLGSALELGRPFTRFIITYTRNGIARLAIRLSHAQYDGLSLTAILSCLSAFLDSQKPPDLPTFSGYVRHLLQQREAGFDHWRSFLQASQITKINGLTKSSDHKWSGAGFGPAIKFSTVIPAPQMCDGYTPATVFTALCASTLASVTGISDVVFGLVVSGRASIPLRLQEVVGPCLNIVPIRVCVPDKKAFSQVVSSVHHQRLQGLEFENIQLSDIAANCTDWPNGAGNLGLVVQFQNIDENPTTEILGSSRSLYMRRRHHLVNTATMTIVARPVENTWNLEITAGKEHYASVAVATVLVQLVDLVSCIG